MSKSLAPDNSGLLFTRLYCKNSQSYFGSEQETLSFSDPIPGSPFHRCVINTAFSDAQLNVFSNPVCTSPRLRLFNAPARLLLFVLTGKIKVGVYKQAEPIAKQEEQRQDIQVNHLQLPLYKKVTIDEVNYLEPYEGEIIDEVYYQVEVRDFNAGDVILAEDIDGLGHTTQMTEQDLTLIVPLKESELCQSSD